jgi:ABC-type spermidine/putrescine transport system permease subunit I
VGVHLEIKTELAYDHKNAHPTQTNCMMEAVSSVRGDAGSSWPSAWLIAPLAVLYGMFALLPLGMVLRFSLTNGFENFRSVLGNPLLLRVATNTIVIGLTTTAVTLGLAVLVAAALWRSGPRLRSLIMAFVLLPFWTAVLIKNFAWAVLLQDNGVVNNLLQAAGLGPFTLLHNRLAVLIGMTHFVLPYAIFPIYTAMLDIDRRLENAARSMGAGTASVIWHVILPLIMPGIAAAALLVFIVSTGFFITPVILGSPSDMMISNLIDYYVHELIDFNNAATLAVLVALLLAPIIVLQQRVAKRGQYGVG